MRAAVDLALTTPLDQTFDELWTAQRDTVGTMVQEALKQSTPGAYDILVLVPEN